MYVGLGKDGRNIYPKNGLYKRRETAPLDDHVLVIHGDDCSTNSTLDSGKYLMYSAHMRSLCGAMCGIVGL